MDTQAWRASLDAAEAAVRAMRTALADLGVPEETWRQVAPVVTRGGGAYVSLGAPSAEITEQIAEALRTAAPHPPAGDDAAPFRAFRRPAS
ncbi:hypothetical protein [Streptomyces sp. NPDC001889]